MLCASLLSRYIYIFLATLWYLLHNRQTWEGEKLVRILSFFNPVCTMFWFYLKVSECERKCVMNDVVPSASAYSFHSLSLSLFTTDYISVFSICKSVWLCVCVCLSMWVTWLMHPLASQEFPMNYCKTMSKRWK